KIWFHVHFTWSVFNREVEVLEIHYPPSLTTIEVLRFSEISQVLMVACHDCKHLFVVYFVVAFHLVQ
ncbi:hypothetical protein AMATHDRAFT_156485, partial [Amanita thiersii Skay4041]